MFWGSWQKCIYKIDRKFIWKGKRHKIVTVTMKKNKIGGLPLTDLKIYFKTIMKTLLCWQKKNSKINEKLLIENLEINSYKYSLSFSAMAQTIEWRKRFIHPTVMEKILGMQILNLDKIFTNLTKIKSKWFGD